MKSIEQLRKGLPDRIDNVNSSIKYFATLKIDYDVFLPTRNKNLQRDFVWTLEQKRELIWSIFYGRNIPALSLINRFDDVWQVIDGKQRLSTFISFYKNEFDIDIEGTLYTFETLPEDYKNEIKRFTFKYYYMYEDRPNQFSDDVKINWFKFINYAGTPQDLEHMNSL